MKIETSSPLRSATISPAAGSGTGAGSDFLAAVYRAEEAASCPRETAVEQPAAGEASPAELYQSLTGRAAVDTAPEKELPALWDDRYLADIIGGRYGSIRTEKTINWSSKGDKELTEEQIARLKEQYNVRNLSAQQYYDLLSDLTQLGALSGEDCIGAHLHTFEGPRVVFTPCDEKILIRRCRPFQTGDMLSILSGGLDILMNHLAWTRTEPCRQMNASTTPEEWAQYRAGIQKDIQCRQKVLALLEQLQ